MSSLTHHPECWREHHECAVALVERLQRAARDEARSFVVEMVRADLHAQINDLGGEPPEGDFPALGAYIGRLKIAADDVIAQLNEANATIAKLQAEPRVHPLAMAYLRQCHEEHTKSYAVESCADTETRWRAWRNAGAPIYSPPIGPVDQTNNKETKP
jgi:hypothetical protein